MSSYSQGMYVKDSAGTIWYAVVRDQAGSFSSAVTFYSDIRCDPATVGQPSAGQIVPVVGGAGGGGGGGGDASNAKLQEVIDSITQEGDETQLTLDTLLAAIQDSTEPDQTQSLLSDIVTSIQENEGAQAILDPVIPRSTDYAVDSDIGLIKSALVRNTGETTIFVNGLPLYAGETWVKEATNLTIIGELNITVDSSLGAVNQYYLELWGL